MGTSIHIPPLILKQLDDRAKSLKISRNKLILRAINRSLIEEVTWSDALLSGLEKPLAEDLAELFESSLDEVRDRRRSKAAIAFSYNEVRT